MRPKLGEVRVKSSPAALLTTLGTRTRKRGDGRRRRTRNRVKWGGGNGGGPVRTPPRSADISPTTQEFYEIRSAAVWRAGCGRVWRWLPGAVISGRATSLALVLRAISASSARNNWIAPANAHGFVVAVPEFQLQHFPTPIMPMGGCGRPPHRIAGSHGNTAMG